MRILISVLATCLFSAPLACEVGPRSGRGLRLPDGDLQGGEVAFRELGCTTCHEIAERRPASARGEREGIVLLGGEVTRIETYGELVTSIINPSHEISRRYPKQEVAEGDVSKMANFNDRMTVTQLIDLTAFLQSKYELRDESLYLP